MPHRTIAQQVIHFEAKQLQRAALRIDESFNAIINTLLKSKGKLIICGIGKSGYIAQKISATLCSTGTPCVFLHAAEAAHGDLGIYKEGDPVLFLSKSGTTPEIVRLIPLFKQLQSTIIAIVGNLNSPIARSAHYVLDASVEREAEHLNLVPTASTTVALAIGDAIAVALMEAKQFGAADFAKFHPAGQLGKNLLLTVADVMHPIPKIAIVEKHFTFRQLIIEMTKFNLGAACVLENANLIGLVTDGDLRRILIKNKNFNDLPVSAFMTHHPVQISPSSSLKEAIDLMENRLSQLSVLPVVENNKCIGLLRIHDIYQG